MNKHTVLSSGAFLMSAVALVMVVWIHSRLSRQHVKLVTVDISRVINAERASVANILKGGVPAIQPRGFARQLKAALARVAGPKAVILVRQAVAIPAVAGIPDITKAVLNRLGLPNTPAHLPAPSQQARQSLGSTGFSYSKYFKHLNARQSKVATEIMAAQNKARQENDAP